MSLGIVVNKLSLLYRVVLSLVLILLFPILSPAKSLTVATINIGMLDFYESVPFFEQRQKALGEEVSKTIKQHDIDILSIQEMFSKKSKEILSKVDPNYELLSVGGDAWLRPFTDHPTGLAFLVKKSLQGKVSFKDFKVRESVLCGFGQICDRGLLIYQYNDLVIINTHYTSGSSGRNIRVQQIDESIELISKSLRDENIKAVIFSGDLNYSPTFGEMRKTDKGSKKDFEENSKLYHSFFSKAQSKNLICKDSYQETSMNLFKFTYDREENLLPLKKPESSYGPSQKVDHIFICGSTENWKVVSQKRIFDQSFESPELDHSIHISDHFGVLSAIELE